MDAASEAILMIAASEIDRDLYYATGFLTPDPFIFLQAGDRKILVLSDLELDRGKQEAKGSDVLSYSSYEAKARAKGIDSPTVLDTLAVVLVEFGVRSLLVPATFWIEHADGLRERGYQVRFKKGPFFEGRAVKSPEEVAWIEETQRHTEAATATAIEAIRQSEIHRDLLYAQGRVLTSEAIKRIINVTLMERECVAQHTIVACGIHAVDPHNKGAGPLRPHQSIVIDVFPRSGRTGYYADMTRTVIRGKASDTLKRMYEAVLAGQERAFSMIRDGSDGPAIHREVTATMERMGFETGLVDGRMQGFFHGTGHGVGLQAHEPPRISKVPCVLRAGHVVTVEPGLYYSQWGAIRIEDMVLVEADGCRNLTSFPKCLEV